ncbi:restriction endonuclease subunit S [Cyanothece sp. BG0011]|uniref:restriction endonuclease subunit S n=1 Tax=Cyanothece sp. BG0011 TaxID=2082950 RepID=UPI000D1E21BA|nr:restriction endonuclease subunit S [Cyanothece sp. BG0011]
MVKNDWKHLKLKEIASIKTGPFGSLLHHSDYKDSGTPIITVEHLSEQGITYQNLPFVSDEDKERLSSYLLQEGDIVFSRVGSVDRSSIISKHENNWLFSGRLLRVRPNKSNVYYPFLNYFFHQEYFKHRIRSLAVGGTMPSLNTQILQNVYVSLPPLKEQQKIAEILSTWDEAIAVTNSLIKAKQKLKRGLMQKLLEGKLRLDIFKSEKWDLIKLGEIADIRRGASPRPIKDSKYFAKTGRGWIRISDVTASKTYLKKTTQYLSELGESKSVKVNPNDLIMSICATIGVPRIVGIKACIHDGFVVIRPRNNNINKLFIYHFIDYISEKLAGKGQPGTQKNLNTTIVSKIKIPNILLDEQTYISNLLSTCDQEIYKLQEKIDHLQKQKRGLMQKLLTGEWRVKDD